MIKEKQRGIVLFSLVSLLFVILSSLGFGIESSTFEIESLEQFELSSTDKIESFIEKLNKMSVPYANRNDISLLAVNSIFSSSLYLESLLLPKNPLLPIFMNIFRQVEEEPRYLMSDIYDSDGNGLWSITGFAVGVNTENQISEVPNKESILKPGIHIKDSKGDVIESFSLDSKGFSLKDAIEHARKIGNDSSCLAIRGGNDFRCSGDANGHATDGSDGGCDLWHQTRVELLYKCIGVIACPCGFDTRNRATHLPKDFIR